MVKLLIKMVKIRVKMTEIAVEMMKIEEVTMKMIGITTEIAIQKGIVKIGVGARIVVRRPMLLEHLRQSQNTMTHTGGENSKPFTDNTKTRRHVDADLMCQITVRNRSFHRVTSFSLFNALSFPLYSVTK